MSLRPLRFLLLMAVLIMALIVVLTAPSAEVFDAEKIDADLVVITSIDRVNHEVFAVNCNGTTISFEEDDDWYVGDYAIVIFKTDGDCYPSKREVVRVLYERPDLVNGSGSETEIEA